MSQPKTREVSWLMMMADTQDDTVWLCLETQGKQRRYSINGNQFRRQLQCLRLSGFALQEPIKPKANKEQERHAEMDKKRAIWQVRLRARISDLEKELRDLRKE